MIQSGFEWQARAIADAAEELAGEYRAQAGGAASSPETASAAFCQGVADVLRLAVGDLSEAETPTQLTRIMRAYSDNI